MNKTIPHSGMNFIAENTFHVESTKAYASVKGEGIHTVEFVRIKKDALVFVEAKTSFPNPNNPELGSNENFQKAVDEICEKFIHSLHLFSSIEVGVTQESYPIDFIKPQKILLVFLLVIKNHQHQWCTPIRQTIEENLPRYLKTIWNPTIYVINQETAINRGFVIL